MQWYAWVRHRSHGFMGYHVDPGGAITDARVVDAQAGAESMMNLLTAALTGTNYILHACGILESYMVSSLEKFIVDEENCGVVKHLRKEVRVDKDTLAFGTIKEVGPQGEFVTHPHTLTHFKSLYNQRIFDRSAYQQWEENGSIDIAVCANREWKKRVENFVRPELSKDVSNALRSYVDSV